MRKMCVFCGKRPESKNLEHIIPHWLIKETGDPNRTVPLGTDWRTGQVRKFAFDQLKFPACSKCNSGFASFEQQAKKVVTEMLGGNSLDARSFDIFLTWLDKIRIGLWLGYRYLDRDLYRISPKFYIRQRIRDKDRMVLIYRADDSLQGIGFSPVNTPFFAHSPTCFGLVINQFYFVNVSSDFLLSRRLGLPFPRKQMMANSDPNKMVLDMREGLERILTPLIRCSYDTNCAEIYQPIICRELKEWLNEDIYLRPYVKQFFTNSRIGRPLIKISDRKIVHFPAKKTDKWVPIKAFKRNWAHYKVIRTVLAIQDYLISEMPSTDLISDKAEKEYYEKIRGKIKQFNKVILKKVEKELKPK